MTKKPFSPVKRVLKLPLEYREVTKSRILKSVKVNESGCWIWQRTLHNKFPHGSIGIINNGVKGNYPAHRVSYYLWKGDIPNGMLCLHDCDEPRCVNPNHLHLGTQKENMKEMRERGRANDTSKASKGVKHGMAKLNEEQVHKIRELRKEGLSGPKIAAMFNVSNVLIYLICKKKSWKHI